MDERRNSSGIRARTIIASWQTILLLVVALAFTSSPAQVLLAQGGPVDAGPGVRDPYFPEEGNAGYDVTHYDLDLQVDPKRHVIRGIASITLTPTVDLRSFTFDLAGFDVSAVDVDGASAQFERLERKLRILPALPLTAGTPADVQVIYAGKPQTADRTGWLWYKGGGALVSTQTNGASTLFPANDHPSDKATFSFSLTVPRGMVGVANGLLNRQSAANGRMTRFEWSEPEPFPTYAAVVAVGRYRLDQGSSRDGLPIISAFPKVDGKKIKNKDRRKATKKGARSLKKKFHSQGEIVSVLDNYFGPYPYSSIGAIVPPIDNLEPIEAASRPTYPGVSKVLKDEDFEQLVAHEIAHQWFGNAVSLRSWRDIWLNEGFSTYGELLWIAAKRNVPVGALFARKSGVFGYFPDMQRPAGDPGADNFLSVTVYNRGALTLEALRRTVGDESFYRILRAYVDEYRGGNATTQDFIALAESISGQNLDALFQRWLYEPGLPELPPE